MVMFSLEIIIMSKLDAMTCIPYLYTHKNRVNHSKAPRGYRKQRRRQAQREAMYVHVLETKMCQMTYLLGERTCRRVAYEAGRDDGHVSWASKQKTVQVKQASRHAQYANRWSFVIRWKGPPWIQGLSAWCTALTLRNEKRKSKNMMPCYANAHFAKLFHLQVQEDAVVLQQLNQVHRILRHGA